MGPYGAIWGHMGPYGASSLSAAHPGRRRPRAVFPRGPCAAQGQLAASLSAQPHHQPTPRAEGVDTSAVGADTSAEGIDTSGTPWRWSSSSSSESGSRIAPRTRVSMLRGGLAEWGVRSGGEGQAHRAGLEREKGGEDWHEGTIAHRDHRQNRGLEGGLAEGACRACRTM